MADKMFPGKNQSDFAVQVTSSVHDAQQFTSNFANSNLMGSPAGQRRRAVHRRSRRRRFGELHISKGAVVWVGKDKTYGRRLTWKQVVEVFETKGAKRKP